MMFKSALYLSILLLASCASQPPQKAEIIKINIFDIQQGSFYTGCIDGFIATIESGMYKRPENMTPKEAFGEIKKTCNFKSILYIEEMGVNDKFRR